MNQPFKLIIAGGKTGGHLFPGIAVADAVNRVCRCADIVFIGTDSAFEARTLEHYGYPHKTIASRPVKGGSIFSKIFSAGLVVISMAQSIIIIKKLRPDFVLGVGGFSSFAVVAAAWICGIPNAIQEQNSIPGLTNRLLSRITDTVFTSFEKTKGLAPKSRIKYVGNPVRKPCRTSKNEAESGLEAFNPARFTILVTGGSQGASSINRAFIQAAGLMDNVEARFNIIHQTGEKDEKTIQQAYHDMGIKADAKAFFHDMPAIQALADIVIARAGAGTLAEICINGLASILIPFPYAADDHQTFNAMALAEKKAAIMIEDSQLTGSVLKDQIEKLAGCKTQLKKMQAAARALAMPDADEKIASFILNSKRNRK